MKNCYSCGIRKEDTEFRRGRNQCRSCSKEYNQAWVKSNPDKAKKSRSDWEQNNNEKIREYRKEYYLKNIESYKENGRKNYQENKESYILRAARWAKENVEKYMASARKSAKKQREKNPDREKQWIEKNPGRKNETLKKWRKNNPEKVYIQKQNRHALERSGAGSVTLREWYDVLSLYGEKCLCCGATENITMDHVKPLKIGGTNTRDNIQPLCRSCNSKKGIKHIDYRSSHV